MKYVGGVRVPPEETEAGAGQRATEDGQFGGMGVAENLKVIRKHTVSAEKRQHRERAAGNHHEAGRKTIQTIGNVDGIARTHYYKDYENVERYESERVGVRIPHQRVNQQIRAEFA